MNQLPFQVNEHETRAIHRQRCNERHTSTKKNLKDQSFESRRGNRTVSFPTVGIMQKVKRVLRRKTYSRGESGKTSSSAAQIHSHDGNGASKLTNLDQR